MNESGSSIMHRPRIRAAVALLALLAALAAPRIALAVAAGDGLLARTLTAAEARQRCTEAPDTRHDESRALLFANLCAQYPLTAAAAVVAASDVADGIVPALNQAGEHGRSGPFLLPVGDTDAIAPPLALGLAPPGEAPPRRNAHPAATTPHSRAFTSYRGRAPPARL